MIKTLLIVGGILSVSIQLIRPARNAAGDPTVDPSPDDIAQSHAVPSEVQDVLRRACYDCHSNHTRYPWYAEIQPLGWWLAHHIEEGKGELNLSEFGRYDVQRAAKKFKEIAEEVSEDKMPLKSYTTMHKEARLTDAEVDLIVEWAKAAATQVSAQ